MNSQRKKTWALVLGTTLFALPTISAPRDRADCEREFKPQVGQTGKNVIWVPTPDAQVAAMLGLAQVGPEDVVYDLGAGDGKIAIAAGKLGAQAVGVEFNPDMVKLAQCLVGAEDVADRTRIVQGDIFKENFDRATVVTMYLLPELNLCLRHRLLAMRPGTRVASHQFMMDDWQPDERSGAGSAYLWVVPARVAGTWALQTDKPSPLTVQLEQQFQKISGSIVGPEKPLPLTGAELRGDRLEFDFRDDRGVTNRFVGVLRGEELQGTLRRRNREIDVTGRRQGAEPAADWAQMLPQCHDYYAAE
jgi:SAM-dependent methyltransferase